MTSYQITSAAGVDMGVYQGADEAEAAEAMHRDAGYESSAAAAAALGTTVEELRAGLTVRPRGPGRPAMAGGARPPALYARVPPADHDRVTRAAQLLGQPVADYVRDVVVRQARADLGESGDGKHDG